MLCIKWLFAVADKLADSKILNLESNIGNQGRVASNDTIWRVFIYFVLLSALFSIYLCNFTKEKIV